jgi:hypothetical protein
MDNRFLLLTTELARIEQRKRQILGELERGEFGNEERQLVLSILGNNLIGNQLSLIEERTNPFFGLPSRRNMLAEIRDLLASDPEREFTAEEISDRLRFGPHQRSFYAALAKLNATGQIRRVRKGVYQAGAPKKADKLRSHEP